MFKIKAAFDYLNSAAFRDARIDSVSAPYKRYYNGKMRKKIKESAHLRLAYDIASVLADTCFMPYDYYRRETAKSLPEKESYDTLKLPLSYSPNKTCSRVLYASVTIYKNGNLYITYSDTPGLLPYGEMQYAELRVADDKSVNLVDYNTMILN